MKRAVWRYVLKLQDEQEIRMPIGSAPICVKWRQGEIHLWAIVNEDASLATRKICIAGTGHPMPFSREDENWQFAERHIGSFTMADDALVFHVFDGGPVDA